MLSLSDFFLQPEFYGWLGTASAHLLDAQILEQLLSAQKLGLLDLRSLFRLQDLLKLFLIIITPM